MPPKAKTNYEAISEQLASMALAPYAPAPEPIPSVKVTPKPSRGLDTLVSDEELLALARGPQVASPLPAPSPTLAETGVSDEELLALARPTQKKPRFPGPVKAAEWTNAPWFGQVDDIFKKAGISTYAWAHNVDRESKGNPGSVGDGGTSYGLFQLHRGGLYDDLVKRHGEARAKQIAHDPVESARYIAEVARRYGVHHAKDPHEQAKLFLERVERPAQSYRQARAQEIEQQRLKGQNPFQPRSVPTKTQGPQPQGNRLLAAQQEVGLGAPQANVFDLSRPTAKQRNQQEFTQQKQAAQVRSKQSPLNFNPFRYDTNKPRPPLEAVAQKAGEFLLRTPGQAAKPEQDYLAGNAPQMRLDADPKKRAKQLAEIRELKPSLDNFSALAKERYQRAVAGIPPTERQWMELQRAASGPGFVTGQVLPREGFLSEEEYRKRAFEAAKKYLAPLSPQIIPTLERQIGRKLTSAQREAVVPLVTAEKLKILNDLETGNAVTKDIRDFLIGWVTGAAVEGALAKPLAALAGKATQSAVKTAGKLGQAAGAKVSPQVGEAVGKAAEGIARNKIARVQAAAKTPLGKAVTETLSPTKAAGAGAGNVVIQAADDAQDPTLKPGERAKRLGEAFVSGAVLNVGAEAALQGLGAAGRLFRGGRPKGPNGVLKGRELAAELDRLSREGAITRTVEVPARPELGVLEVVGREGDTVVAQAPNGVKVKVSSHEVRFTPTRPEVPERANVTIQIDRTPQGEAIPIRITEKGGVKVQGVRPLDFEATSDVVDLYDAYHAGKVSDFTREVGGERFERAFNYWEALDKDGTTEEVVTGFRKWLGEQQEAEAGRMLTEVKQVEKATGQTGRQLVQDAYGGTKDKFGNTLLPDHYTNDQLERIVETLNSPGRQKRTYQTNTGKGFGIRDLVMEGRMIPPDALPRGGRKKGEVKVEPRVLMEGGSPPTPPVPRIGKDNVLRVAEGRQIARGKQALKSRIDFEVRKKALDTDVAKAAHSFLDLLPDKYVEGLGSSYYAGREVPPDLVDGQRGALGYYSPTEAIIGIAKLGANLSKTGERVVPHEVTHHLERFVPENDFKELNWQYLREKKANHGKLQSQIAIANRKAKAATTATEKAKWEERAGELRQQAYRYNAFSEWFADTIVDKAMRDIYPDDAPTKALYQRVAENLREVVEAIRQYLIRQGHPDVAEAVYRRFKEGEYGTTRAKRPMGTVDEKLLAKGFDLPAGSGAYRLDLSTGEVEKLDKPAAKGETVRGKIVASGTANVPKVEPAAPNVSEKPKSPIIGPTPPQTRTKSPAQAQKPAEPPIGPTGGNSDRGSLKNRIQAEKVEAGELPRAPEKGRGMGPREADAEARKLLAEGFDPEQFARDFAAGKEVRLTGPREAALVIHAAKLEAEMKALQARVAQAVKRGDGERARALQAEYDAKFESVMQFLDDAQKAKTEGSNVFRAMQSEIDLDTGNFVKVLSRAEGVSGRKASEFTPQERQALQQSTEVFRDIQERLDATTAEVETLRGQVKTLQGETDALRKQAQQKLDRGKIQMELPGAENLREAVKRQKRKESLRKERAEIGKELLSLAGKYGGRVSANPLDPDFFVEAAPLIKRLAHNLYAEGQLTLDAVVEQVRSQFRTHGFDLSPQQVIDAIAEAEPRAPVERKPSLTTEARKRSTAVQERETVRVQKKAHVNSQKDLRRAQAQAAEIASLENQLRTGVFMARQPGLKPPTRTQAQARLAELRAAKGRIERKRAAVAGQTVTTQKRKPYSPATAEEAALDATLKAQRQTARDADAPRRKAEAEERANVRMEEELAGTRARPRKPGERVPGSTRHENLRYQVTIRRLEQDIAEWKRRLTEGDFAGLEKQQRVVDERLADLRAEREIARRKVMTAIEATRPQTTYDKFSQGANVLRGVVLGSDIGVLTRQGLFSFSRPLVAAKSIGKAARAAFSETEMVKWQQEIADRRINGKSAELERKKAGLQITDHLNREEMVFLARALERIPIISPVGAGLERFQTTFINSVRAELFDNELRRGLTAPELALRARFINNATGRSNIKSIPKGVELIMTSPRYEASRWAMLAEPLRNAASLVRKGEDGKKALNRAAEANLRDMAVTAAGALAVFQIAQLAGYEVNWDPTSTDFLAMRRGEDVWRLGAGMDTRLRDVARLIVAFNKPSFQENWGKTIGKGVIRTLSPAVKMPVEQGSLQLQKARGEKEPTLLWEGFKAPEERQGLVVFAPIIYQTTSEAWRKDGPEAAAWAAGREFVGQGVSRYPVSGTVSTGLGAFKPQGKGIDPGADVDAVFKEYGVHVGDFRQTFKKDGVERTIPEEAYRSLVEVSAREIVSVARTFMRSDNYKKGTPQQRKRLLENAAEKVKERVREDMLKRLGWE